MIHEKLIEAVGYWAIGFIYMIAEVSLVFIFADTLGFPAWSVVTLWVVGGAYPRYLLHKWWLNHNNFKNRVTKITGRMLEYGRNHFKQVC